jgi:transcriptional regulator with XRE-family HTH domain
LNVKNRLKEWRKKRGLTQSALGELAGCSDQMISRIESEVDVPSEDLLKKICLALKCSARDIFPSYSPGKPLRESAPKGVEIKLSEKVAPLVRELVAAGGYADEEEVLNDAIRRRWEWMKERGLLLPPEEDSGAPT